jgi:acetyl-CoA carboxylase biotin carboxylase subunit
MTEPGLDDVKRLLDAFENSDWESIHLKVGDLELADAFDRASAEAERAFGDGSLYVERYVTNARHVEVQILADAYGTIVHLGERDCSAQRRYQKLVEEAPAPTLSDGLRGQLHKAATSLAAELGYIGAGTVEFLVDIDREAYFFLEVNTRLQVEHPVTEMITGIDIVREQLRIAAGRPLSFTQDDVTFTGHAIECRINAESPAHDFLPSPGRITRWTPPVGTGVRLDSHCADGVTITPDYDSLLGKLICHGSDRREAIELMLRSLARFDVRGVDTTIALHRRLIGHHDFLSDRVNTAWVEKTLLPSLGLASLARTATGRSSAARQPLDEKR